MKAFDPNNLPKSALDNIPTKDEGYPRGKWGLQTTWDYAVKCHEENVHYEFTDEMLELIRKVFGDWGYDMIVRTNEQRKAKHYDQTMRGITK